MTNWSKELQYWIDSHDGLWVTDRPDLVDDGIIWELDISTAVVSLEELMDEGRELKKKVDKYEAMLSDIENLDPKLYDSIEAKWERTASSGIDFTDLEK